ncbi:hypothetical protein CRG98_020019 [Punica granatum]|uniref:Uncharacterized protein n=1 Tax=Punica granatum TaxID=22663 RepID=A0A2I0JUN7_PUNGR|nr:hypothetical protein CRG98_020019 [Punica granatum]
MESSSAFVTSHVSKSGEMKWTMAEHAALISCMIDLRNMGTHNADTGFKSGYLPELEKMLLEKALELLYQEDPGSASSGKKRKKNEVNFSTISQAVNKMAADMKEAFMMLSKSVHSDIVQEKVLELPGALRAVDGLTSAQVCMAIQKFGNHPNYIPLFFGTDPEDSLEMVQNFLANH